MEYYSNSDKTKLIATNRYSCAIITKSGICTNSSFYTIPYRKHDDETLQRIDEQEFKSEYDKCTAMMIDLFNSTLKGKGINTLLPEAKR